MTLSLLRQNASDPRENKRHDRTRIGTIDAAPAELTALCCLRGTTSPARPKTSIRTLGPHVKSLRNSLGVRPVVLRKAVLNALV
jgi:hypothetical protein